MSHLHFIPVDSEARNGKHHLLRDARGHQHCGQYKLGQGFTYSGGRPIDAKITHYAVREGN